jgi:subtilisin family serine protease
MARRSLIGMLGWAAALLTACQVPMPGPAAMSDQEPIRTLARLKANPTPHRQVAIGFKSLPADSALKTLFQGLPVTVKRVLSQTHVVVVTLKQPDDKALLAKLAKLPGVEYAEWEGVGSVLADLEASGKGSKPAAGPETGDPMSKDQWALDRIQAPAAWTLTRGSQDTVIAIVDTGIDLQHPDLRAKLVGGINITDPGQSPKDDFGHGTHVAGIAAALTGNGVGIAGMAPAARLMPVKVNLPESGGLEESAVADGILWAANHGADVINLSLGFADGDSEFRTLGRAVYYAMHEKKCVVVAAMGNNYKTAGANHPQYPAGWAKQNSLSNIVAVGATTPDDRRWDNADTGPWQTLSAPGFAILSTTPTYKVPMTGLKDAALGHDVKLNYGRMSGTSMATPYVSGLAALLLSRMKNHEPGLVKLKLAQSADRIGSSDVGAGRVNALATLKLL